MDSSKKHHKDAAARASTKRTATRQEPVTNKDARSLRVVKFAGLTLPLTPGLARLRERARKSEVCDPARHFVCEECRSGPGLCAVRTMKLIFRVYPPGDVLKDPAELDRVLEG